MGKGLAALMLMVSATFSPNGTPREVVQSAVGRVVAVLNGGAELDRADRGERVDPRPPTSERARTEIRRIAAELFDFDEMARRTLSRHWAARTRAQQAEFVTLFTDLLERSYITRIEGYAGEKIAYVGDTVDGNYAVVRSKISSPRRRADTTVDYRLIQKESGWKVYDVVIDGVSFVSAYRSEFNRVIAASSYGGLVDALRARRVQVRVADRRP
jgi:phospholipid transport system substrate-binding protein